MEMSREEALKLLQEIADLAHWGPRNEDYTGQAIGDPDFSDGNYPFRVGAILGTLQKYGIEPTR